MFTNEANHHININKIQTLTSNLQILDQTDISTEKKSSIQ